MGRADDGLEDDHEEVSMRSKRSETAAPLRIAPLQGANKVNLRQSLGNARIYPPRPVCSLSFINAV